MEQISKYIIEKLKISSNSKVNSNDSDIKIDCTYDDTIFTKQEFEQIIDYSKSLPIKPDSINNGGVKSKVFINLTYDRDINKKGGYHTHNIIRIRKFLDDRNSNENGFIVRFIIIDEKDTFIYPEDVTEQEYYESIDDCFEIINKKWKELDYSKSIEKYK